MAPQRRMEAPRRNSCKWAQPLRPFCPPPSSGEEAGNGWKTGGGVARAGEWAWSYRRERRLRLGSSARIRPRPNEAACDGLSVRRDGRLDDQRRARIDATSKPGAARLRHGAARSQELKIVAQKRWRTHMLKRPPRGRLQREVPRELARLVFPCATRRAFAPP